MSSINLGKILVKTVGAAALGCVGYDAYKKAKWQAKTRYKNTSADLMTRIHMTAQSTDELSATRSKIKNSINEWYMTNGITPHFSAIGGFISGAVSSLVDNVVPFGLAAGTLMLNKGAKYCAFGLGLYAAKFLITDVLGIGKPDYLPETV